MTAAYVVVPADDAHPTFDEWVSGQARHVAGVLGLLPLDPYQGVFVRRSSGDRVHMFARPQDLVLGPIAAGYSREVPVRGV